MKGLKCLQTLWLCLEKYSPVSPAPVEYVTVTRSLIIIYSVYIIENKVCETLKCSAL